MTDAVLETVAEWQGRPLDACYPLVFFDAIRVKIEGVTPHTLRHTFGSVAGDLGFSELTIRAMLGHASQNVTQNYVHIDEALKLAMGHTSGEIEKMLVQGCAVGVR